MADDCVPFKSNERSTCEVLHKMNDTYNFKILFIFKNRSTQFTSTFYLYSLIKIIIVYVFYNCYLYTFEYIKNKRCFLKTPICNSVLTLPVSAFIF